ncbi:unnamed protein product, partial [Symbiodinium necroappetens]
TIIGVVILGIGDPTVKEHLVRHAGRLDSWMKMRAEILAIARTQKYLQSGPQPMDIGPCFYCQKMGHTKAECRKRLADPDLKKAEQKAGKGRPAAAAPEEEPEQESVAASTLCVAVPACSLPTESPKHKLLLDTGAGGGLAPCGFDFEAQQFPGPKVSMTTFTGEPLELGKKKVSSLQHEKVSVSFAYRESKDVSFPVISMSGASSNGTWLVIGPNTQCLVPGPRLEA